MEARKSADRESRMSGSRVNRVFKLLDMRAGARGRSSREVEAENRRYLEREVERRVQEQLRSGSRSGSSQQQRAGANGRSSKEVKAEN